MRLERIVHLDARARAGAREAADRAVGLRERHEEVVDPDQAAFHLLP